MRKTAATLCLFAAAMAQAEPASYLKIDDLVGTHKQAPYRDWTELQGVSFSIGRSVVLRGGGGSEIGKPEFSAIRWQQAVDTTMPPLLGAMVKGDPFKELRVQWVARNIAGDATVAQLRLRNVFVTSLTLTGENFEAEVNAEQFGFGFKPFMPDGSLDGQRNAGYDLTKSKYDADLSEPFTGLMPKGVGNQPTVPPSGSQIFVRHDKAGEAGASRVRGYENWSEVSGLAWNAGAPFNFGGVGGVGVGKAQAGELSWVQGLDNAAFQGLSDLLSSTESGNMVVEFTRDAGNGPVTFMQLALTGAFMSGWTLGGDTIQQSVAFASIVQTVWDIQPNGKRGKPVSVGWDLLQGKLIPGAVPVGPAPGFGAGGLTGSVSAIPEPQTALLLGAGLLVVVLRRRRNLP